MPQAITPIIFILPHNYNWLLTIAYEWGGIIFRTRIIQCLCALVIYYFTSRVWT